MVVTLANVSILSGSVRPYGSRQRRTFKQIHARTRTRVMVSEMSGLRMM